MSIEKKAKQSISQRQQQLNDMRSILATDYGQRFLQRLIDRAGIYQPTYGSGSNPTDFAFMEGRREFGLFVLGEITQANHAAWIDMQQKSFIENQRKEHSNER